MNKARILMIVDDQDAAHSLENQLKELDYEVVGKASGEESALRLASELLPDLLILAPNPDGMLQAVKIAGAVQTRIHLPVCFIAPQSDADTLQHIRTLKPGGFVLSPYHPVELAMAVEIALQRQSHPTRLAESETAYRSRTEHTLRRRDLILNAVGYAAEQFFKSASWEDKIQEVLGQLGRATNSSRVYIFRNQRNEDGLDLTSMRYEWIAPGVLPRLQTGVYQDIDLKAEGLSRWVEVLEAGGYLHAVMDDLPEIEKRLLVDLNAQSILIMPILVAGYWWGSIGFDQVQAQFLWSNADIDALRAASGILAGAIQRAQTQAAWNRAEEKYRGIFENAVEGVFQSSPEGAFITANPALAHMLGYETPQELMASVKNIHTQLYVEPGVRDEIMSLIESQNFVKNYFLQLRRKDGSLIWVTQHARAVRGEDGRVLYYEGFIQDITDRRRAEDSAQNTYERYIELVNSVEGIVWEADCPKTRFYFISQQAERILGYPLARWYDQGFWERLIYVEDRAGAVMTCAEKALETSPFTLEYRMVTAGGRTIWVRDIITVQYQDGKPYRLRGLMVDVTEMHRHQHRQEVLVAVANALRSVDSSVEMRSVALDMLYREMWLDGVALALPEANHGSLTVVRGVGCFANRTGLKLDASLRPVYKAFREGVPYRHPAVQTQPDLIAWLRAGDPDALVIVPLTAEVTPMGVLFAARREGFSAEDTHMLLSFGGLVSNAIQRALSNERMVRSLKSLSALHEIDQAINDIVDLKRSLNVVLGRAAAELGADALDVFEFNEHTQTLELLAGFGFKTPLSGRLSLRLGQGIAGQVVMEGKLVHLPDLSQQRERLDRPTLLSPEGLVSYYGKPLISKDKVRGILEVFYRKPYAADSEMLEFLEILAGQIALAIDNAALFTNLKHSEFELSVAYDETLEGWAKALEARDKETQDHSLRVTDMSVRLAQVMRVPREALRHIRRGALLHDIGKMGVPDAILLKETKLSENERRKMEEHTLFAYTMLSSIPFLRPAMDIPVSHHEKWDGSGYPRGLKGKEIPLAARIFCVVDVWDALSHDRPYRAAWSEPKVLDYLISEAGKHFDPDVVKAFLSLRAEEGIFPESRSSSGT